MKGSHRLGPPWAGALEQQESVAAELTESQEIQDLLAEVREAAPTLTHLVRRLRELSDSGALDGALELVELANALRLSLTDGMVAQLADKARVGLETLDVLMRTELPDRLPALVAAAGAAAADARTSRERIGPLSLLRAIRQPEMQHALRYLLALARHLPGREG